MSLWLTDDELVELTGYRQRERQKQALAEMRIAFRVRPADGFPLVARAQFTPQQGRKTEPNFGGAYG